VELIAKRALSVDVAFVDSQGGATLLCRYLTHTGF